MSAPRRFVAVGVQRQQPAQRQVDLAHLGQVEAVAEAAQLHDLGLDERLRDAGGQSRPFRAVDLAVEVRAQSAQPSVDGGCGRRGRGVGGHPAHRIGTRGRRSRGSPVVGESTPDAHARHGRSLADAPRARVRSSRAPGSPRHRVQHRPPARRRRPPGRPAARDDERAHGAAAHALPRARRLDQRRGRPAPSRPRSARPATSPRPRRSTSCSRRRPPPCARRRTAPRSSPASRRRSARSCRCSAASPRRASPSSRCAAGSAGPPARSCSSTSAAARSRSRPVATSCRMSRHPSPSAQVA